MSLLAVIGPGFLVAATGVGAGDLGTAGFAGSEIGLAVLWAVVLGAFLKFVLNEGLARWQLATGDTLLEGSMAHLGRPFQVAFLLYLLPWTFCVGSALMSACGVTLHSIFPVFSSVTTGKVVFGIASSLAGLILVQLGGYRLFQKVMSACIAVMFATVVTTAFLIRPDWGEVIKGLVIPRIPHLFTDTNGLEWTVALIGGVGGTLTVLCYGYWIREEGREGGKALRVCRIDLAIGYTMTALFGIAMVIIASRIDVSDVGKGAGLITALAERLEEPLGRPGRWIFLIGAFGAVFSSLLGVWQSVPYVFADFLGMVLGESREVRRKRTATGSKTYLAYLFALAFIPMINLPFSFKMIQKYYAVVGAGFIPFLAFVLLYLNAPATRIGGQFKNRWFTNVILVGSLIFFLLAGALQIHGMFQK